jgi:hypothetical protein
MCGEFRCCTHHLNSPIPRVVRRQECCGWGTFTGLLIERGIRAGQLQHPHRQPLGCWAPDDRPASGRKLRGDQNGHPSDRSRSGHSSLIVFRYVQSLLPVPGTRVRRVEARARGFATFGGLDPRGGADGAGRSLDAMDAGRLRVNLHSVCRATWTGAATRSTRRSSPRDSGRRPSSTQSRGRSSTTTRQSTSTTSWPGSPSRTAPPCCRAWPTGKGPEPSTSSRTPSAA